MRVEPRQARGGAGGTFTVCTAVLRAVWTRSRKEKAWDGEEGREKTKEVGEGKRRDKKNKGGGERKVRGVRAVPRAVRVGGDERMESMKGRRDSEGGRRRRKKEMRTVR